MKRKKPLRADPEKVREFQDRARQRAQGGFGRRNFAGTRIDLERVREALERVEPKRRMRRRRRLPGESSWKRRVFERYGRQCVVCGCSLRRGDIPKPAAHAHHAIPRQTILGDTRKPVALREQLAYDSRNGVPVCVDCHTAHEAASRRIPRACLPGGVIEWAERFDWGWYIERTYPVAA